MYIYLYTILFTIISIKSVPSIFGDKIYRNKTRLNNLFDREKCHVNEKKIVVEYFILLYTCGLDLRLKEDYIPRSSNV